MAVSREILGYPAGPSPEAPIVNVEPKAHVEVITPNVEATIDSGIDSYDVQVRDQLLETNPDEHEHMSQVIDAMAIKPALSINDYHPFNTLLFGSPEERSELAEDPVIKAYFHELDEKGLGQLPAVRALRDFDNPTSTETTREWHRLIPKAVGLLFPQNPNLDFIPGTNVKVQESLRPFFVHCYDAVGLRSRAAVMSNLMRAHFENLPDDSQIEWTSLASGAADPVLKAIQSLNGDGKRIDLRLVDWDEEALAMSEKLAVSHGLEEGQLHLFNRDIKKLPEIANELGRAEAVDILGLFEYLPATQNRPYAQMVLATAYHQMLEDGGLLVFGNMRSDRPQYHFNQDVVRWPIIKPRSLAEISRIVKEAGIPLENAQMYLPKDGVYSVVAIRKHV